MDGEGPFPKRFHPGLRLEDKWIQYQLVKSIAPVPETLIFNPLDLAPATRFLEKRKKLVLKRRVGRGGRDFEVVTDTESLSAIKIDDRPRLLQEHIESRINGYVFSIRAIAFGGAFMCMYANLSVRSYSNHGILTFVSKGEHFRLENKDFRTEHFDQKSWEAEIWFGQNDPSYLRHNLYEDEVGRTTLFLPDPLYRRIEDLSTEIEGFYEGLDLSNLPKSCFEDNG
jgi:hypothetical protein